MNNDLINSNETDDIIVKKQENTGIRVDEQNVFKIDSSISDVTGAGAVAKVIGNFLEPRLMQKRLEQFENTLEMIKEYKEKGLITSDMSYSINGIEKNASLNSVDERAINSLVLEEISKQINIESIARKCLDYIEKDFVPQGEIDDDWLYTFRDSVKNISSEELQSIWAKLLANEIQSPSTYSLRTLDTLKNMSKYEAEKFKQFIKLTITDINHTNRISITDPDILLRYGITYNDILLLQEIGLIQVGSARGIIPGHNIYIIDDTKAIDIKNDTGSQGTFGIYITTKVGTELASIVIGLDNSMNYEYIKEFINSINKNNKYKVIIHENYKIIGNGITYESSKEFK